MQSATSLPPIVKRIGTLSCCCAESTCKSFLNNKEIMVQLESDLRMAAELGQHLLKRHDDYVVEVQQERHGLLMEIERQSNFAKLVDELETNNRLLEIQNEKTMRENLALLKRLEDLNSSLNVADTRNHELRTNLLEAETTVGRLSHRATKARGLEAQIATAELEREVLEKDLAALSLTSHQSDARYRQAERHIRELQSQLETIESESHELEEGMAFRPIRANKVEITHRGPDVDLLKDVPILTTVDSLVLSKTSLEGHNAELQRVLASTQDEVVMLRERLASQDEPHATDIKFDNDRAPRKSMSQELHQHNHYHYHIAKPVIKRDMSGRDTPASKSRSSADSRHIKSEISRPSQMHAKDKLRDSKPLRTPMKANVHLGMTSPPSTKKRNRDSGYFSFASDSGRERSTSLTYPASPSSDIFEETLQTSTPLFRKHLRSSSHDSVFMLQNTDLLSPAAENHTVAHTRQSTTDRHSLQDLSGLQRDSHDSSYPGLRHSTSHESVLDMSDHLNATHVQMYPSKVNAHRRPYPSPLQNNASSATVSITSATAYNSHSASAVLPSPRGKSYTALRSAAAAQRLSPSTTTPPAMATSPFWKRNSERTIPSLTKATRSSSSRWTSLVPKWASLGDQGGPVAAQESLKKPVERAKIRQADTIENMAEQGTAVSLSGAEEALLREALDL